MSEACNATMNQFYNHVLGRLAGINNLTSTEASMITDSGVFMNQVGRFSNCEDNPDMQYYYGWWRIFMDGNP